LRKRAAETRSNPGGRLMRFHLETTYLAIAAGSRHEQLMYSPLARAAADAAGARRVSPPGGKTVAFVGKAPKRVGIQEWESLEKAQAFRNSDAFKKLTPQRDKAVKTIRSYAVESN
jgi:uncharacterized protein (DUF1330 family)